MKLENSSFKNHPHWTHVKAAVEALQKAGYQALLAGGCVRDALMGREPNDFDIATDATPDQARAIFPKSLEVGKKFGVTILPIEDFQLEIATFRKDGLYTDGRRPDSIEFSNVKEDALRRDFTVNAMFADPLTGEVSDFVGGEKDLKAKVIRAVGDPRKRFEEDKLRILRAVRFAAQLDFLIEADTLAAIKEFHDQLNVVSKERIHDEVIKLFKAKKAYVGIELLRTTGLLHQIVPGFLMPPDRWQTMLKRIESSPPVPAVRLCLFLLEWWRELDEIDREQVIGDWLRDTKFSSAEIDQTMWVLKSEKIFTNPRAIDLPVLIRALSDTAAGVAGFVFEIDSAIGKGTSQEQAKERLLYIQKVYLEYLEPDGSLPKRWVTGADLQTLGVKQGPELGVLLQKVYDLQLEKKLSSREQAIAWIKLSIEKRNFETES